MLTLSVRRVDGKPQNREEMEEDESIRINRRETEVYIYDHLKDTSLLRGRHTFNGTSCTEEAGMRMDPCCRWL